MAHSCRPRCGIADIGESDTVYNGRVYGVLAIVVRTRGGGRDVNPRYAIDNQLVLLSVATIALQ